MTGNEPAKTLMLSHYLIVALRNLPRLAPGVAIERRFADDYFDDVYSSFARINDAFTALTGIALLIAATVRSPKHVDCTSDGTETEASRLHETRSRDRGASTTRDFVSRSRRVSAETFFE